MAPALLVIAKEPLPGRAKTRLTPPCSPDQAAGLAAAALADTLDTALAARGAGRRILVFEGDPGAFARGFEVIPQRGHGLDERLAAAFEDAGGPAMLIGMDTPQVTPALLDAGLRSLERHDAVFGPATDGGYWAIGLRRPDREVFEGVPMSVEHTGAVQRGRLADLGLSVALLPPLCDVDDIDDARTVAAEAPSGRFAAVLRAAGVEELVA
jgi:uncharacterized protein